MIDGRFSLTDHNGARVTNETYRGRHMLVFFGFSHCKVVCPRALARLSEALDSVGAEAEAVQPLYISVDPERDTPDVLKAFLAEKYPRFVGLTGTRPEIDAAKKAFRVFAEAKADADEPDGYVVPHTAFAYLLDRAGAYVAHFPDHVPAEDVARGIRSAIQNGAASSARA